MQIVSAMIASTISTTSRMFPESEPYSACSRVVCIRQALAVCDEAEADSDQPRVLTDRDSHRCRPDAVRFVERRGAEVHRDESGGESCEAYPCLSVRHDGSEEAHSDGY